MGLILLAHWMAYYTGIGANMKRMIDTETFLAQCRERLNAGETVPLVVTGGSMTPFLVHKRDAVLLSKIDAPVRRGDIILYTRAPGLLILHRACHIKPEGVYFAGDAQTRLEGPVAQERMVARAVAATRKGKQIAPGSSWWEFFRGFWRWVRPARPFFMGAYGKVHALAGHKHEQHRKQ